MISSSKIILGTANFTQTYGILKTKVEKKNIKSILDFAKRNNINYLDLIANSDIILDSLDWSGLNTSLEAISLDKPIITLPSNFMRGRHSYGVLKNSIAIITANVFALIMITSIAIGAYRLQTVN